MAHSTEMICVCDSLDCNVDANYALLRYAEVVESVKNLVEDSERFVGKAPASQP